MRLHRRPESTEARAGAGRRAHIYAAVGARQKRGRATLTCVIVRVSSQNCWILNPKLLHFDLPVLRVRN